MGKLAKKCNEKANRNPRKFDVYAEKWDEKIKRLDDRHGRSYFSNGRNSFLYNWRACKRSIYARTWYHRTSSKFVFKLYQVIKLWFKNTCTPYQNKSSIDLIFQKIVTTLSDFIYVETADSQTKDKTGQNESSSNEQELEDQLMGLGERWTVLCNWVEHRASLLEMLQGDINTFYHIKKTLSTWIEETEKCLKTMEQQSSSNSDPNLDITLNTPLIINQLKELKVRLDSALKIQIIPGNCSILISTI